MFWSVDVRPRPSAFSQQVLVQVAELLKEAVVGPNRTARPVHSNLAVNLKFKLFKTKYVPDGSDGFLGGHVMFDHQVGSDDSGRSADSGVTVDQHFTCSRTMNEFLSNE